MLERHPALRVAFLEADCSWLPWLLYRIDDQPAKYLESELPLHLSEHFLRQCVISMEADEAAARDVMTNYGDGLLVISADYPYPDSPFPHTMDEFFEIEIPDAMRRRVLWDNCTRLYRLG